MHTTATTAHRRLALTLALLCATLVGLAGGVGVQAVAPAPAHAASTCYGDYCSGKDPNASGCAADGRTVASKQFSQHSTKGVVEVRWSARCKTNWTRVTLYSIGYKRNATTGTLKSVQDTGYTQSTSVPRPAETRPITVWTPMIYSPVKRVRGIYRSETNPCSVFVTGCAWRTLEVVTPWA